jgi:hypothetical protein
MITNWSVRKNTAGFYLVELRDSCNTILFQRSYATRLEAEDYLATINKKEICA